MKMNVVGSRTRRRHLTPLLVALLVLMGTGLFSRSGIAKQTEQSFPYQALVVTNDAVVRSGPAKVHYGTDSLEQGETIEVFRHDPGNWCAIRPPEGSFSMLPASTVEMVREGVAEVKVEDARAWVGTRLGPVENPLWQVKLRKGELVKVVGETSLPDPAGFSSVWYQIEPPPGEFRWVHQDDLKSLHSKLPHPDKTTVPKAAPAQSFSVLESSKESEKTESRIQTFAPPANRLANRLPKPDLNTREDRPIGSGLRVDLAQQKTLLQMEGATSLAFEDPPQIDRQVQLTAGEQELIGPANQEGLNEGWRPSSLPRGRRRMQSESIAGATSDYQRPAVQWNEHPKMRSTSTQVSDQERFADAAQNFRQFALQMDSSRANTESTYMGELGDLKQLEAVLTREMLKPDPGSWQLDGLVRQIHLMQQRTLSVSDKANLDRLHEKVQQCQRLNAMYTRGSTNQAAQGVNNCELESRVQLWGF